MHSFFNLPLLILLSPRQQHMVKLILKSNISKKMMVGESLTFSFLKIIRRRLLFARLSYYFTPVLGSQSLPRSSRLPFWPAGFILPPIIENLLIYFFSNMDPLGAGAPRSLMGNGHMETTHFKKGLPLFVC